MWASILKWFGTLVVERVLRFYFNLIQDYLAHQEAKKKLKLKVKEIRETIKDPASRARAIRDLLQ